MIGQLRHKVTVKTPTVVSDGFGGQTISGYGIRCVLYAQIKTATGSENIINGAVQNVQNRTIVVRNEGGIQPSDLVCIDGEDWLISDIEQLEDKPYYLTISLRKNEVTGG